MSRKVLMLIVLAVMLVVGVAAVSADEDPATIIIDTEDYGQVMAINDGRLNGVDVAAPVAVYYTYETNEEGVHLSTPTGIELLGIDQSSNNGYVVMDVSAAQVQQLISGAVSSIDADGYSLHYASNWFWLTAPADSEGKVYVFQWENLSFPTAS